MFKKATEAFSGSKYPTSNLFLRQIWKLKLKMNEKSSDTRDFMKKMTIKMNEKFAKYWGECNLLMAIGVVLDPRYKMQLIKFCFPHIYSAEECDSHINEVRESLHALYSVYASKPILFGTHKLLRISIIDFSLMLVLFLFFLIIFLVKQ